MPTIVHMRPRQRSFKQIPVVGTAWAAVLDAVLTRGGKLPLDTRGTLAAWLSAHPPTTHP